VSNYISGYPQKNPKVTIQVCNTLNPASLLPSKLINEHLCKEVISQPFASRLNLTDKHLVKPDAEWFTDGKNFVLLGESKAGYLVVSQEEIIESGSLPVSTSTQNAELIALTRTLILGQGKRLNLHIDSKYVFLVFRAHTAIRKESSLLTGHQSPIKHSKDSLQLLQAIQLPKKLAVIHCRSHQRDLSLVSTRNNKEDTRWLSRVPLPCSLYFPLSNKMEP
jgi:hypothetical protein